MEANPNSLLKVLHQHLDWYPRMELQDAYKLLYQGILGPEHMVATSQEFSRRLAIEFKELQPEPRQRVLEPVRADASLFRLNLRPYKSRHNDTASLVPSLLQTSKQINGTITELVNAWAVFTQLCLQGEIQAFDEAEIEQFGAYLEQEDFPTVHHSEVYRREYQPAYRLISHQFTTELGLDDAG